jgi:hypothetical protein
VKSFSIAKERPIGGWKDAQASLCSWPGKPSLAHRRSPVKAARTGTITVISMCQVNTRLVVNQNTSLGAYRKWILLKLVLFSLYTVK